MSRGWRFWHWPEFLHGKGHAYYDSAEAKELYAKQLIALSEKVFWRLFAPLLGYYLKLQDVGIPQLAIGTIVILCTGLYFRHQGLRIIDELKTKKLTIVVTEAER